MSANPIYAAGIDLGGSKIETRLFDADFETIETARMPTPRDDYDAFKAALLSQLQACIDAVGVNGAIGIAFPGFYHQESGRFTAKNIPVGDHLLAREIEAELGRRFTWENDCKAFALSEAHNGAGASVRNMIGLIMGTGLAAGSVQDGELRPSLNQAAVEIGHIGVPADLIAHHALPLLPCKCGRSGCWEAYVSGTGVENLALALLGERMDMPDILARKEQGDHAAAQLYEIWLDLTSSLMVSFVYMHDPEVIVIGGGLSLIEDLPAQLHSALRQKSFNDFRIPKIAKAKYGDSSGVRGAAILAARQQYMKEARDDK